MTALSAALLAAFAAVGFVLLPLLFVGTIVVLVKLTRRFVAREPATSAMHPPRPAVTVAQTALTRRLGRGTRAAHASPRGTRAASHREVLAVWRYRQLLQLDVDPVAALGASLGGIDTAAVRSLIGRGCPPDLAVEIVAPAEELVPAGGTETTGAVRPSRTPGSRRR